MSLSRLTKPCGALITAGRTPYTAHTLRFEARYKCMASVNINHFNSEPKIHSYCRNVRQTPVREEFTLKNQVATRIYQKKGFDLPENAFSMTSGTAYNITLGSSLLRVTPCHNYVPCTLFSTGAPGDKTNVLPENGTGKIVTKGQALKAALATYGPIILVFHFTHSLFLLGLFYVAVKSGVDLLPIMERIGGDSEKLKQILSTSSTFVIAYALYKTTAPIRIGVTLAGFPVVLRVLRRLGFKIKPPVRPTPEIKDINK